MAQIDAPHPFSPRSDVVPELAPDGKTLVERSVYDGVALWWLGRTILHERTLRMLWFHGPDTAHRFDAGPVSTARFRMHGRLGRLSARRVPIQRLDAYREADHRVLYTGQNRQWPGADGTASDRFFGPVIARLHDDDIATASTYPLSGSRFPWYRPSPGKRVAFERNANAATAPHIPFERFAGADEHKTLQSAARHFGHHAEAVEAQWDDLVGHVPALGEPRARSLVRDAVLYLFRTVFPVAVLFLTASRRALDRLDPHLLLLVNEYGLLERALQVAAQERGIPTLAVQHGVIHPYHPGYVFPAMYLADDTADHLRVPLADRTAVYGPHHRSDLVERLGWPDERVVVTGHPGGDRIHGLRQAAPRPPTASGPVILWLTQVHGFPDDENAAMAAALTDAASAVSGSRLVIKPHPNDDPAVFASLAARADVTLLDRQADLYQAILEADVAVTKDSTTALEAMACGRPVVILNTTKAPDRVDYVQKRAALRAQDGITLAEAIRATTQEDPTASARQAYVADQFGPIDGRSVERLAALACSLIR